MLFVTVIQSQPYVYKDTQSDWRKAESNFQQTQKRSDKYLAEPILDINIAEAKVKPLVLMSPFVLLPEKAMFYVSVSLL